MKTKQTFLRPAGFTLIELLVVIAIIGILAGLLLPALSRVKLQAKIRQTETDIAGIVRAVTAYETDYSRMPLSAPLFANAGGNDITFGRNSDVGWPSNPPYPNPLPSLGAASNDEVVNILMDKEVFPNVNHVRNTKRVKYLAAKDVGDNTRPGVGPDGIYRDAFGTPFVISFDLNSDEKTTDAVYRQNSVSGNPPSSPAGSVGHNGLVRGAANDSYQFNGSVMVWSMGPDKQANAGVNAKSGVNKDNILSWAQ